MQYIEIDKANKFFSKLIEQTISEDEVIITKGGEPIVKLIAITKSRNRKKRQFGSAKGFIKMAEDFDEPLEDFQEYM